MKMHITGRMLGAAFAGLLMSAASAGAQVPPGANLGALGQAGPAPARIDPGRTVISPIVHPDGRVTLNLNAPDAKSVSVTGHIIGLNSHRFSKEKFLPLTKDAKGIWSITLGPLAPEIYDYAYAVDSAVVTDPGNRLGLVEVPAPTPTYYDVHPVPHGDVHLMVYESKAIGATRYLRIYTPPGYEKGKGRYPVLYLMHGASCCEYTWQEQGRANIIMDNLIAEHKARPMIVVMALGGRSGPSDALGPVPGQMETPPAMPGDRTSQSNDTPGNLFEIDLLTGIIPFVERNFRAIPDADHRAFSGLSQGGIQTLTIGLRHTDVFHWLVPMSAGAEGRGDDQFVGVMKDVYTHPEALKKNLKLLYFVVGTEDVLHEANKRLVDLLRAQGVKLTFQGVPGMHQWSVWRRALHETAPLLFTSGK